MDDLLQTGTNARLQVTFRDKTELSLGENATVTVDRYVFDPDASVGAAALNVTKGAFRLATGRLSAMRNQRHYCHHGVCRAGGPRHGFLGWSDRWDVWSAASQQ